MEAGEYGLTPGTCFVARRLELAVVAWLLCGFRGVFWVRLILSCFISLVYFFLRTRTACCKFEAALPHLSLYWCRGAYRVALFN